MRVTRQHILQNCMPFFKKRLSDTIEQDIKMVAYKNAKVNLISTSFLFFFKSSSWMQALEIFKDS